MAELYLTLVSGRTVHVCSDWDGAAPTRIGTVDATGAPDDGEGIEVGEYYRDIHRYNTKLYLHRSNLGKGILDAKGVAVIPTGPEVDAGSATGLSTDAIVTVTGLSVKPSDEVNNAKPRTWPKVCTWLVFTGQSATYEWRAASVDGWSSKAPID